MSRARTLKAPPIRSLWSPGKPSARQHGSDQDKSHPQPDDGRYGVDQKVRKARMASRNPLLNRFDGKTKRGQCQRKQARSQIIAKPEDQSQPKEYDKVFDVMRG